MSVDVASFAVETVVTSPSSAQVDNLGVEVLRTIEDVIEEPVTPRRRFFLVF